MPKKPNDEVSELKEKLHAAETERLRIDRELSVAQCKIVQLSAHNSALARMLKSAMVQLANFKK